MMSGRASSGLLNNLAVPNLVLTRFWGDLWGKLLSELTLCGERVLMTVVMVLTSSVASLSVFPKLSISLSRGPNWTNLPYQLVSQCDKELRYVKRILKPHPRTPVNNDTCLVWMTTGLNHWEKPIVCCRSPPPDWTVVWSERIKTIKSHYHYHSSPPPH